MTKKCPFCSETIQVDAKKCRYCGEWIVGKEEQKISKAITNKAVSLPAKLYLIWLALILIFFSAFFFSENGFISDTVCIFIVGLCAILGIVYFIKLAIAIRKISPNKNRTRYIFLTVAGIALFFVLAKINPPIVKSSADEAGLRKTVEEQYKLVNQGEQGIREIYRNYISSSSKSSITEDKYIKEGLDANKSEGIQATKYEVHDILIDGIEGYVDRTVTSCSDSSCENVKSTSRVFRKYIYENSKWRMTQDPVFCPRKQMYEMPPEFSRAISLISQRYPSTNDFQFINNCLKISYATNDSQMEGAEGFFKFVPGQSPLELDIFVSPRYKETDELVTAFLLAHEGQHAADYVIGLGRGNPFPCFEDEGRSFYAQFQFLTLLNKGEKDSLIARFYQLSINSSSPELWNIVLTNNAILKQPGADFAAKTFNYVKTVPAYQKECAGR